MLGRLLRAGEHSPLRTVAAHLESVRSNSAQGGLRDMGWNWMEGISRLINGVDGGAEAARLLGPHVNLRTLLPRVNGKDMAVPRGAVGEFDDEWRARCRAAVGDLGGRDSRAWGRYLKEKGNGYEAATRVEYSDMASSALPQGIKDVLVDRLAGAARPVGTEWTREGPDVVGTTATAAFLAALSGDAGHHFGAQGLAHHLCGWASESCRARVELRTGFRCRGEATDAEGNTLPGGYLWGARTCASCAYGASLDARHRIVECAEFDEAREEALQRAERLVGIWGSQREARKESAGAASEALRQVTQGKDTLPWRNTIFLATLAQPVPEGAAAAAGLPQVWAEALLRPPRGTKGERAASLTAALFRAFEPLAVAVRKPLPTAEV